MDEQLPPPLSGSAHYIWIFVNHHFLFVTESLWAIWICCSCSTCFCLIEVWLFQMWCSCGWTRSCCVSGELQPAVCLRSHTPGRCVGGCPPSPRRSTCRLMADEEVLTAGVCVGHRCGNVDGHWCQTLENKINKLMDKGLFWWDPLNKLMFTGTSSAGAHLDLNHLHS